MSIMRITQHRLVSLGTLALILAVSELIKVLLLVYFLKSSYHPDVVVYLNSFGYLSSFVNINKL